MELPSLALVSAGRRRTRLPQSISELETFMSLAPVEQRSYEMPPKVGIAVSYFLTVADIGRAATSAIPTVTSSKSGKAIPASFTAKRNDT